MERAHSWCVSVSDEASVTGIVLHDDDDVVVVWYGIVPPLSSASDRCV